MKTIVSFGLLLLAAVAQAQTNPLAKGPDPTSAALNAAAGPFAVATASVSSSVSDDRDLPGLQRRPSRRSPGSDGASPRTASS